MKLTRAERELIATAHHEAGHAVAAVLAGGRVTEAVVHPRPLADGEHGRVTYVELPDHQRRAVAYAGPFAEARYRFGPFPTAAQMWSVLADSGDLHDELQPGHPHVDGVATTVRAVWPAIRSLAADLFMSRKVDHETVLAALGADDDEHLPVIASSVRSGSWSPPTRQPVA